MLKNMGNTDRMIRGFVVAPILLILAIFAVEPSSAAGIVLVALAAIMAGTAAVGSCPLYMPFGLKTCKTPEAGQ